MIGQKLRVDVWSDVACPWCYVGKRRLEQALSGFPHAKDVEIRWHSFELDPAAPKNQPAQEGAYLDRLAQKFGGTRADAQKMLDRMIGLAKEDGLDLRFDRAQPGNTFDAHRLLHLAEKHGKQDALKERLFRAHFTDGLLVSDPNTLRKLAREEGLDAAEVEEMLSSDRYAAEVRADIQKARELGINGVPFFLLADTYGASGAQPAALLLQGLNQAWADVSSRTVRPAAQGEVCGPDGC